MGYLSSSPVINLSNLLSVSSSFVPKLAANNKTIVFGDFSYYWIADRQGRSFKRLNELSAATG